ncbi:hypothetical protein [Mesorhizobium australicum]|uniref:Uncharacterized protein n=1 Tax=Mesorhizobium australicum TaxID=536018 RepID=A0A1X7NXE3_9HYPH|nr:hypothetical protein [Mesorhizobium australicum]SMH42591.1 hypothetical protein SAMN02982922_2761 [Mesorhizobium australicum]
MEEWIEEFLYRGRPPSGPGSEMPSEFQVTIGQQAPNPFDPALPPSRRTIGPLTPTQAAEAGWPVERLVAGLNAAALRDLDAAKADLATVTDKLSAREAELLALTREAADATTFDS